MVLLCLVSFGSLVACGGDKEETTKTPEQPSEPTPVVEATYKLGMGVVVNADEAKQGTAQVDSTVAAVVTDAEGKIVACRIDALQNKASIADGVLTSTNLTSKADLKEGYNMAAYGQSMDWNEDGVVLEWYLQAQAFEAYVVGMTSAEVAAIETAPKGAYGYVIATDEKLLNAGCTIQIGDFIEAVVKAMADEQGTTFKTSEAFTLGVSAKGEFNTDSKNATADAAGTACLYGEYATSVVINGKIAASLNDAIQPKLAFNFDGTIGELTFKGTKRELKEGYNMSTYGANMDPNGDGKVLEWYLQSQAFSAHVVGMTGAEVAAMETAANSIGYQMTTDADLLAAGCTIQITSIKAVVSLSVTNAR